MVFVKCSSTKKLKMKKYIVLFLSIVFATLAYSQTLKTEKQTTISKPTADKQKAADKSIKSVVVRDTLKRAKIAVEELITVSDSLQIETGNFKPFKKTAYASYYAGKFHGKKTASGKLYNQNAYTAAHKKLPFGTKVRVTNEVNGKSVIVEINDRGPFVKSREIDLSKRSFMEIAKNKGIGIMTVTIEILED